MSNIDIIIIVTMVKGDVDNVIVITIGGISSISSTLVPTV